MKVSALLLVFAFTTSVFIVSCGDGGDNAGSEASEQTAGKETHGNEVKPGDVTLASPLDTQWVSHGKEIYDMKCQACHKLSDERVVGPGWKGVTQKREPHWILNMITNVDMMLETDPEAQKLLEQCLVRMPNQNISKDDARHVLEFMRSNDGEK